MKTQNQEPKIVRKPKEKKPGKVAQIEALIIEILKTESISKKEMISRCPEEHNSATWQTRIYRLISKGVISFDKESKMLKIVEEEEPVGVEVIQPVKAVKPIKAVKTKKIKSS